MPKNIATSVDLRRRQGSNSGPNIDSRSKNAKISRLISCTLLNYGSVQSLQDLLHYVTLDGYDCEKVICDGWNEMMAA